jgi:hypothetical protein
LWAFSLGELTMKFVLIEKTRYSVYEGKVCLAIFELQNNVPLTAEEVEQLRTDNYDKKA